MQLWRLNVTNIKTEITVCECDTKIDEFGWHEAIDRTFLVQDFFQNSVVDHPVISHTQELAQMADEIGTLLGKLYQRIGELDYQNNPQKWIKTHDTTPTN